MSLIDSRVVALYCAVAHTEQLMYAQWRGVRGNLLNAHFNWNNILFDYIETAIIDKHKNILTSYVRSIRYMSLLD